MMQRKFKRLGFNGPFKILRGFTPLEIMPRCSAAGLDFRIIPAGFNAPLEFLTGFTIRANGLIERVPPH